MMTYDEKQAVVQVRSGDETRHETHQLKRGTGDQLTDRSSSHMSTHVLLICCCLLSHSSLAVVQDDDLIDNKIPDFGDTRNERDDDEMVACDAKDGCGFESSDYAAHSPLIPCDRMWDDFIECDAPLDLRGNETARTELGFGCTQFGGQRFEDVQKTSVNCSVLDGIECFGNRTFTRTGVPCIKYTGHYFVTTLVYSILMGFLGMDRFILGHTGTAVGKLLTLGGVGIWWLVDIVLLVTGHLMPEDGSSWMPIA